MRLDVRLYQRENGTWYAAFSRTEKKSLGTKDKAEARRLFGIIKREYLAGKLLQLTGECGKTLAEYAGEFLAWAEENQPRTTFRANRLALDKIRAVAGDSTRLDRLGAKHLDAVITESRRTGLSVFSINNYIRHAKSALKKAVDWGYLKVNPFRSVKEIRVDKSEPKAIPAEDLERFIAAIEDPEVKALAGAFIVTGRRRKEIFNLCWEDVDFENEKYKVIAKGGRKQTFPLTEAFRAVLDRMRGFSGPTGRIWKRWKYIDTVTKVIKVALVAVGLDDSHLHDLRHSYARMYLEGGGKMRALQDLLGHAEGKTTEIYGSLSFEHLRKEAERVKMPTPKIRRIK